MPRRIALAGAAIVCFALLGTLSVSLLVQGARAARANRCMNNFSMLWKMQHGYMAQFGGHPPRHCEATGGDFWLALSRTPSFALVDPGSGVYSCPAADAPAPRGTTHYRGPASDVNAYADGDAVGACSLHAGVVVVLHKSSDVEAIPRDDPRAQAALRTTRP